MRDSMKFSKIAWMVALLLLFCTGAKGQKATSDIHKDADIFDSTDRNQQFARVLTGEGANNFNRSVTNAAAGDVDNTARLKQSAASLEGTVMDDTGASVPGVVLSIREPAGTMKELVTDAAGHFLLTGSNAASPATSDSTALLVLPNGSSGRTRMSFDGSVKEKSGQAAAGLSVIVRSPEGISRRALTDSQGSFHISGLQWDNKLSVFSDSPHAGWPGSPVSRISFWALQGALFATTIAAAQTTSNCINSGSCTAIPTPFHSRAALYNLGLPVAAGFAVLSYEMKRHGNRWWYVPPAVVTGLNSLLIVHSVHASH